MIITLEHEIECDWFFLNTGTSTITVYKRMNVLVRLGFCNLFSFLPKCFYWFVT